MNRHNLLVTPYVERAMRLTAHLKTQGIDAKLVTRYAVQVDPRDAEWAFSLGPRFMAERNEADEDVWGQTRPKAQR